MRGAIRPLPPYAFMAWCSVKAQSNCMFTFYLEWRMSGGYGLWGGDHSVTRKCVSVRATYEHVCM